MKNKPIYNLKAVLLDTGLKPDTLRAWERRYGIPAPRRTDGGHRLYSDQDVAILKWLIQRQAEGLSISRAVRLWKDEFADGYEPLPPDARSTSTQAQTTMANPAFASLEDIRNAWLAACYDYDEVKAEEYLNLAFGLQTVETVCVEVLLAGIAKVGMDWQQGLATVQQEHYTTALAIRRLDSLLSATPAPNRPQTILIGCPPDEWHAFTPLLFTLFLRRKGFNVLYLGPNVPASRFQETMDQIKPSLVILSAQLLTSAASLSILTMLLSDSNTPIGYGGRIFNIHPDLRRRIHGEFLGETIEVGIQNAEKLLTGRRGISTALSPSTDHLGTLGDFLKNRSLIEANILDHLRGEGYILEEDLKTANHFMGDTLIASLELGDLTYLDQEVEWLGVMLRNNQVPVAAISYYLKAYHIAVMESSGTRAQLLLNWLSSRLDQVSK